GTVPSEAPLAASSKYLPHLADRKQAWLFPVTGGYGEDAQVILVDAAEVRSEADRQVFERVLRRYPLAAQAGNVLLFDRQALQGFALEVPGPSTRDRGNTFRLGSAQFGLVPYPRRLPAEDRAVNYAVYLITRGSATKPAAGFLPHDLVATERINLGLPWGVAGPYVPWLPHEGALNPEAGDTLWLTAVQIPREYILSADEYVLDLLATPDGRRTITEEAMRWAGGDDRHRNIR
ncbi:MAG TPA: hypothetical protein VEI97_11800, partial [bacterium]|nr:hypothetical protein [bacterium]